MSRPDYTAIMLLVDRSGSMAAIKSSAESGINEFIGSMCDAEDKRTIRIAQFDWDYTAGWDHNAPNGRGGAMRYETWCQSIDPSQVPPFVLTPKGATPLLDAMGTAITEFAAELAAMPEDEQPGVVIFAIMTDGIENASREYTQPQIREMVTRQETEFGWQVVYLGANQDAFTVGEQLGIRRDRTMTYSATGHGTRSATQSMASYVASAACGQTAAFTDEQRADAVKEGE